MTTQIMLWWNFFFIILGGLAEEVDEKILHSAFIPFGDITDINIPLDYETGKVFFFLIRKTINILMFTFQRMSGSLKLQIIPKWD